jgi:hypothetical protein
MDFAKILNFPSCEADQNHSFRTNSTHPARKGYLLAANVYRLPRKGYPQDALFAAKRVELRGASTVALFALSKVPPATFSIGTSAPEMTWRTKLRITNTSAKRACNSRRMSSSVFRDLKPLRINTSRKVARGAANAPARSASPFRAPHTFPIPNSLGLWLTHLESNSCIKTKRNANGIKLLRKNWGGRGSPLLIL